MIGDKVLAIRERIKAVCQRVGRNPQEIALIGITKYATAETIKEAIDAGLHDIGENRVQDAAQKFRILDSLNAQSTRHLVGHLQTNKAKQAVQLFDVIQSVDSLKLAQELQKHAGESGRPAKIFIEVNTSKEEQKYGLSSSEVIPLIEKILTLKNIQIFGLMTIASQTEDQSIVRNNFRELKSLFDKVKKDFKGQERLFLQHLSMGMSNDFEIAIEEGSNMVRVGSAIFG